MRILNALLAVYWAVLFIMFVTGTYTPDKFDIGVAFLFTALGFTSFAMEAK